MESIPADIKASFKEGHQLRAVGVLSALHRVSPFVEVVLDRFQVFRRVKAGFFQVVQETLE